MARGRSMLFGFLLAPMASGAAVAQEGCFCLRHTISGTTPYFDCQALPVRNRATPLLKCRTLENSTRSTVFSPEAFERIEDGTEECNPCEGIRVTDGPDNTIRLPDFHGGGKDE